MGLSVPRKIHGGLTFVPLALVGGGGGMYLGLSLQVYVAYTYGWVCVHLCVSVLSVNTCM